MSTFDFSTRLEQEECPSRCIPIGALLLAVKNAELEKKGESIEGLDWVALQQEHKQAGKRLARLSTVVKQAAAVHQNAKDQTRQSSRRRSDWRWCWRQTETRGRGRFQSCTARKRTTTRVDDGAGESEARNDMWIISNIPWQLQSKSGSINLVNNTSTSFYDEDRADLLAMKRWKDRKQLELLTSRDHRKTNVKVSDDVEQLVRR
ncbi:hypothetical protein PsorP6_003689 [Peronosclerospora sorghi]|uniref:Uncharacterized protein n=1 Tax=Peronosclerospora sorghi TaxID=230839 RepID=A0ACC0VQL5_9STRA|nr:hypothetical protein PsorP6_003689 [Peronosclerospora sorghi]